MTTRLAISVGLTRVDPAAYDGWNGDCPGCDRDAARIATLCHDAGFDGVSVFINQAADHLYVRPAFEAAAQQLGSGDLLLLYFSGHGGQQRDTDGDEEDGHDETLCWYSGEVNDDVIASYLRRLRKGVRVLFVTDSCNSGTNFRGTRRKKSTPVRLNKESTTGFRGSLLHFGGCADGRYSYGDDKGGDFTLALADAFSKSRKPLAYWEWFDRAAKRMTRQQTPTINSWGEGFSTMGAMT